MSREFDYSMDEWKSCLKSEKNNLIEKCLKIAQILEYPNLDISSYIEKINDIGISLRNLIVKRKNITYQISILNEYLFDKSGFQGDMNDYYNPKNNFLNHVIENKSGIPITLSIIYSEVAKYLDLDFKIVGFPSHVIVKFGDEMLLDPFHHGKLLSLDDLQEILYNNYGDGVQLLPEYLNETSTDEILIRMLRNLKNSYTESYAYEMAKKCNKMILVISPESPEEIRDLGIIENKLNQYEKSIDLLNHYLELEPNADDVDIILELIKEIREKINYQ
jgi:regulator of sirC expression with transglutaminase-like and TPR domain|tara:strand:+ start:69 stop:896 length:828 start_codon:yes stop_codon:yes gene_type:complete